MSVGAVHTQPLPGGRACPTWDALTVALDALAWDGAHFRAADAAALRRISLRRAADLILTARVREHNQLAIDSWKRANPPPAGSK